MGICYPYDTSDPCSMLINVSELNTMLLELIIEFHAWASVRPTHESEKMADVLEKEIKALRHAEAEQGTSPAFAPASPSRPSSPGPFSVFGRRAFGCAVYMRLTERFGSEKTRQRLHEFITRIRLALAALTGLAP